MFRRRFPSITRGGFSTRRILDALGRRAEAIPHNIAYELKAGSRSENARRILSSKDIHAGQRCFVQGNGPSLSKVDLGLLQNEISFGINRIFLIFPDTDIRPDYYVCINRLMIEQSLTGIESLDMPRFVNWHKRKAFSNDDPVVFVSESFREPTTH